MMVSGFLLYGTLISFSNDWHLIRLDFIWVCMLNELTRPIKFAITLLELLVDRLRKSEHDIKDSRVYEAYIHTILSGICGSLFLLSMSVNLLVEVRIASCVNEL
ncbi:hypothetical protein ACP275_14G056700 [Erythranthe tilingii]